MKTKKNQVIKAGEHAALLHQLKSLGFKTPNEYKNWCNENGFSTKKSKTSSQYAQEITFKKRNAVVLSINSKKEPNTKRILKNFVLSFDSGHLTELPAAYSSFYDIYSLYKFSDEEKKGQIKRFLLNLINDANLLENVDDKKSLIILLREIFSLHENWVRDASKWRAKSHNTVRQFNSLLRHLFVKYEMPAFMDKAWLESSATTLASQCNETKVSIERYHRWYLHLGLGNNPRTLPGLPIPFTKKMGHWFMKAPSHYRIPEAIRFAQVLSMGGNQRLVDNLRETSLCQGANDIPFCSHEDFWETVLRWFILQPMFDYSHVPEIIDYLRNQKFQPRNVIENGVLTQHGPAQPGLTMKDREPEALLRQVEEWHNQLGREKKAGNYNWVHSAIPDFEFAEGQIDTKSRRIWTIRELCSSGELQDEGRKMRHCVSSYAHSCKSGRCTIWTLEKLDNTGKEKQVTIEVNSLSGQIVQIRGRFNAKATAQQMNVIQRWATVSKLNFGSWL